MYYTILSLNDFSFASFSILILFIRSAIMTAFIFFNWLLSLEIKGQQIPSVHTFSSSSISSYFIPWEFFTLTFAGVFFTKVWETANLTNATV